MWKLGNIFKKKNVEKQNNAETPSSNVEEIKTENTPPTKRKLGRPKNGDAIYGEISIQPTKTYKKKIDGMPKVYLVDQLAKGKPLAHIQRDLKTLYNVSITYNTLFRYKKQLRDTIEDRKDAIVQKTIEQIPIASENTRLDREEALYNVSQTLLKPEDKINYGIQVLREARKETENLEPVSANIQFNQFNNLTDPELLKMIKETEKKIAAEVLVLKKKGNGYEVEST